MAFRITLIRKSLPVLLSASFLMLMAFSFRPISPVSARITAPSVKYSLDKSKSSVSFAVTHMVMSEAEGNFKVFGGSLESTKPDYSDGKVEFSIEVKSVNTANENRDKHLRGADFFDAAKFPLMTFVSTSFTHLDGDKYKLAGNLTIKDVSKPVTFDVTYAGISADQKTAVFDARTTLDRFDYGLKWSKMTEAGGLVVSRDVRVTVKAAFRVK